MIRSRFILFALIVFSTAVLAERTKLKPKTNSPANKDVELGIEVAKDAERELALVKNADANNYVAALGKALVAKAPNDNRFPFVFKIVDDKEINAFALPGGPVYVNRGAIESADNEAQIAGVIGHEIAHVILRHGMAQAEKAEKISLFPSIVGAVFGGSTAGKIAAAGVGFAANSVVLRYSRDAESEADLMGTQILYDSGYDPVAMAEFFDKLARDHKGGKGEQFFSNHPIPENRITKVNDEIKRIGGAASNPRRDSESFQRVKKLLLAMPEPAKKAKSVDAPLTMTAPPPPSSRMSDMQVAGLALRYPDNWKPAVQGNNITLAPQGGINEKGDLAWGMVIDIYKPTNAKTLELATSQFIEGLSMGNPDIKVVRGRVRGQLGGQTALVTELSNVSPAGGQETDLLYTVMMTDGNLRFFVQVAPTKTMSQYENTFRAILDSIRFR